MRTKYSFHFYEVETTPLIVRFFKALFLFLFTVIATGVEIGRASCRERV